MADGCVEDDMALYDVPVLPDVCVSTMALGKALGVQERGYLRERGIAQFAAVVSATSRVSALVLA